MAPPRESTVPGEAGGAQSLPEAALDDALVVPDEELEDSDLESDDDSELDEPSDFWPEALVPWSFL